MNDANPTHLDIALVQYCATTSIARNIALAAPLIRDAAATGATLVCLPEVANLMQRDRAAALKEAQAEADEPALAAWRGLAVELGIWLHLGSLVVRLPDDARFANRAFLIDPAGKIRARYDKIHMFDVNLDDGEQIRESRGFRPGSNAVLVDMPWGGYGLSICYDLRFPYLYRGLAQAGADVLSVPAAFTRQTGEAHWHTLLRARAIENGCFVIAAAQCGDHEDGRRTFGHSLVVDPWGVVLADGGTEPGVTTARLDFSQVARARDRVPSLQHDRAINLTREKLYADR